MTESIHAALKEKQKLTSVHLIGAVEQMLGRAPSDAEIARNVRCDVKPDGTEQFFWDDELILQISPTKRYGGGKVVGWEFTTKFVQNEGEE
jgi:hypothetical protein